MSSSSISIHRTLSILGEILAVNSGPNWILLCLLLSLPALVYSLCSPSLKRSPGSTMTTKLFSPPSPNFLDLDQPSYPLLISEPQLLEGYLTNHFI